MNVRFLITSILIGLAILSLGSTAFFVINGYSSVFFFDQWEVYKRIGELRNPLNVVSAAWPHHAGHRMLFPYLLFWANGQLFSWSNAPLLILNATLQSVLALVLIQCALSINPNFRVDEKLSISSLIAALLFFGAQIENFIWGMQLTYFLTFTFAVLAMYENAHARRINAFSCAAICSFSMANGMVIWPILMLQTLMLKRNYWDCLWPFAIACVLSWIYTRSWSYANHAPPKLAMALQLFVKLLGGPANLTSGYYALLNGIAALTMIAILFLHYCAIWRRNPLSAHISVLWGVIIFTLCGAGLTVLGRDQPTLAISEPFGIGSRYMTNILILWAALSALAWGSGMKRFVLIPVLLFLFSMPHVFSDMRWWSSFFGQRQKELAAPLCHGQYEPEMSVLHPDRDTLISVTRRLKERRQGFGAELWCRDS